MDKTFFYQALDANGKAVESTIDASSAEDALEKIRNLGCFPTIIRDK